MKGRQVAIDAEGREASQPAKQSGPTNSTPAQASMGNAAVQQQAKSGPGAPGFLEQAGNWVDGSASSGLMPDWAVPEGQRSSAPEALPGGKDGRASRVFGSSHAFELLEQSSPGESTPELAEIMRTLQHAPSMEEAAPALQKLALLRGDDSADALLKQYPTFLAERQAGAERGYKAEAVNEKLHPNFLGSPEQMAYGRITGDVLGMDPYLSALLNPTGGLVGPGNDSSHVLKQDCMGAHGTVHDAAGFLNTNGYGGPGYSYLPGDEGDMNSPMSGQNQGTQFFCGAQGKNHVTESGAAIADIAANSIESHDVIAKHALTPDVQRLDGWAKDHSPKADREANNRRGFTDILGDQMSRKYEESKQDALVADFGESAATGYGIFQGGVEAVMGIPEATGTMLGNAAVGWLDDHPAVADIFR